MSKREEEAREVIRRFEEALGLFPREVDLVEVEEAAREAAAELAKRIRVEKPKTEIFDKKNVLVKGYFEILNVDKRGELKELLVISPSKNFDVVIMTDNAVRINKSFTELMQISQELSFIAAFENHGSYVVNIKDLKWLSQCMVLLKTYEEIKFQNIFARYDLFLE